MPNLWLAAKAVGCKRVGRGGGDVSGFVSPHERSRGASSLLMRVESQHGWSSILQHPRAILQIGQLTNPMPTTDKKTEAFSSTTDA